MTAATVDEYIDALPEDRRIAIRAVREAVNAKLPPGYEEGVVYGLISWFVPFTRLAETYNGQPLCVASLGAQKNHMALYLMSVYGDPALNEWFTKAWKGTGKKLDMGKSCIRFKKLDDLALDVIGEAIARVPVDTYVASYEASRANTAEGRAAAAKAKAKEVVGKVEEKAKAVVHKVEEKAKQAAGKAKQAAGKAKQVVSTAKQAAAKAKQVASTAKQVAGKAKAVAGKAKQAAAKAKGASTNASAKAKSASKTASAKAKAAAANARTKLAAKSAGKKPSARA